MVPSRTWLASQMPHAAEGQPAGELLCTLSVDSWPTLVHSADATIGPAMRPHVAPVTVDGLQWVVAMV